MIFKNLKELYEILSIIELQQNNKLYCFEKYKDDTLSSIFPVMDLYKYFEEENNEVLQDVGEIELEIYLHSPTQLTLKNVYLYKQRKLGTFKFIFENEAQLYFEKQIEIKQEKINKLKKENEYK